VNRHGSPSRILIIDFAHPSPTQSRGSAKQRWKRAVCASGDFSGYDRGTSAHGLEAGNGKGSLCPARVMIWGLVAAVILTQFVVPAALVDVGTAGRRTITTLT